MREWIAPVLLLLGCGACGAQTVIPFQLRHGLVEVRAAIDGKPVRAVLDTGTSRVAVDERHAEALGLRVGYSTGRASGSGKRLQLTFSLGLRTVQFGPITLDDVSAIAMNLSPLYTDAGTSFTALLGYPLFAQHVVKIDYADRKIYVYPAGHDLACKSPIRITGFAAHTPVVSARLRFPGSRKFYQAHLIVDTGTIGAGAVLLGRRFLRAEPVRHIRLQKPAVAGNGTGGKVYSRHGNLAELDLGQQRFMRVPVALTDQVRAFNTGRVDGSLGVALWKHGSITLDYPRRELCLNVPDADESIQTAAAGTRPARSSQRRQTGKDWRSQR